MIIACRWFLFDPSFRPRLTHPGLFDILGGSSLAGEVMFEKLFLVLVMSALVMLMFRSNLQIARRCLRPLYEDERMDTDGQIVDRTLFQRTVAHAFQQTIHAKRWMIEVGKYAGAILAFEFWHFYAMWETYLLLIPVCGYGLLFWVAGNHITIVDKRIKRLSESDRVAVDQMLVKVRAVK